MSVATRDPIVPQPRPIRATHRATGATVMLVPSQSVVGKFHVVQADHCDCAGFRWRGACSHLETARRELAAPAIPDCGICDVPHGCHCPRLMAFCRECVPQPAPARIPLVARMYA